MPVRLPVAALVLAVGLSVGLVAVVASSRTVPDGARPPDRQASVAADRGALAVLRAWDERRAAAWAAGDAEALAGLYTSGSSAGRADVRLLRRYTSRGLVVLGMRMQVLRARVLRSRPRVVELEVTDRLASAVAVRADGAGVTRRLPTDRASTRRLVLRRIGGHWLMVRVAPVTRSAR